MSHGSNGQRRRPISEHYTARIVVEKVKHSEIIEGAANYEKIVQASMREVEEVTNLVVKNASLSKLKSMLTAHVSLIDDGSDDE